MREVHPVASGDGEFGEGLEKPKRKRSRKNIAAVKSLPCIACGFRKTDPAHVKSRGAGGGDEEFNVMPLCRRCHTRQHTDGWYRFALDFISVSWWLYRHGWVWRETRLFRPIPE